MIGTLSARTSTVLALWFVLTIALIAGGRGWQADESAAAQGPERPVLPARAPLPTDTLPSSTNCRYGISQLFTPWPMLAWAPMLGAGWFANFNHYEPIEPHSEFVFTIRLRQLFDSQGARLPAYKVLPPLAEFYEEDGDTFRGLGHYVRSRPGAMWLVGNEIEIDNTRQDNIMPEIYARAYHEVYHYIKGIDPTARVAIGSVTMGTPGRLQYLDIVWDTYRARHGVDMPVDVWNFHVYILPERTMSAEPHYADGKIALGTDPALAYFSTNDPDLCPSPHLPDVAANDPRPDVYCKAEHDSDRIFREQVYNLRRWMKEHGQQDKPLIISEYGSLFAFEGGRPDGTCERRQDEFGRCMYPERVATFFRETAHFMENTQDPELGYPQDGFRLVQRWLWYSLHTPELIGDSSNLLVDDYTNHSPGSPDALTLVGQAFREEAWARAFANLIAESATSVVLPADNADGRADAVITASFRNSGTLSVVDPFTVTFYADAALTSPIGSVVVKPAATGAVAGCSWGQNARTVNITWPNLPLGTHPYWARIDSGGQINETDEGDNITIGGVVTIYAAGDFPYTAYLPITRWR